MNLIHTTSLICLMLHAVIRGNHLLLAKACFQSISNGRDISWTTLCTSVRVKQSPQFYSYRDLCSISKAAEIRTDWAFERGTISWQSAVTFLMLSVRGCRTSSKTIGNNNCVSSILFHLKHQSLP